MTLDLAWYLALAGACGEAIGALRGLTPEQAWCRAGSEWRSWVRSIGSGSGDGFDSGSGSSYGYGRGFGSGGHDGDGDGDGDGGYGYGCGYGCGCGYGSGSGGYGDGEGDGDGSGDVRVWDGARWIDREDAVRWLLERVEEVDRG